MFDLIPSKDYREFIEKQKIELTDRDKATLIFNHKTSSYDERLWALFHLMKTTNDKELKNQIEERMTEDREHYLQFVDNEGNAFYELSLWDEGEYKSEDIFMDFQSAHTAGVDEGVDFKISKEIFACKKKAGERNGVFGTVTYDSQGYKKQIWLYTYEEKGIQYDKNRFEERYIDWPLMFRQKDIVHIIGTDLYGIVDAPIDDEDELKYCECAKRGDYHDFQITVNLIYKGKKFLSVFSHDHVSPVDIEYAKFEEGDARKGVLEYMRKTLYENSLFFGTGRDAGRIQGVLSELEKVWKQYPDMRLGQLLVNVCGDKDLFAIEDENLLERLQYNVFPIE